ncbi:MAG: sugar ABC transporter permease [Clostridia bacterium]|nr:sugar ABC transporter permease [Clostridia bacterium]
MQKSKLTLKTKDALTGGAFMLPWLIGLLVFTMYPFFYSIWLSLCQVEFTPNGIATTFVGFKWYAEAFTADANFIKNMTSTMESIIFSTPMIVVAAVILALLLNRSLRGRAFFRVLYFFPVIIISGPVMSKLMGNDATTIVHPDQYAIYQVLEGLPELISTPLLYIFDNIVLILWYSGVQMLIILAGLQKIGDPIYEAASIDGAGAWEKFWKITLPYLRPMILVSAAYTIVDLSGMTTTKMHTHIVNNMMNTIKPYSYSSALSWLYALAVLIVLGIMFLILMERRPRRGK